MKTSLDVIDQAYRRLGIKAEDEQLTADQRAYAGTTMDGLHAELSTILPLPWWPDMIPDAVFLPLANLLAVELAPAYEIATEPRGRAFARLMAVLRPDDRPPYEPVPYRDYSPEWF